MKPPESSVIAVLESVSRLRVGDNFIEAVIDHWEAIRPPDPALTFLRDDLDKHRDAYSNLLRDYHALQYKIRDIEKDYTKLLRDYHALHDAFSKFNASDPAPVPLTFPDPPHGWTYMKHNLTPEQIGIADGWRPRCYGETVQEGDMFYNCQRWARPSPGVPGLVLSDASYLYRTMDPLPDPKPTAEEIERAAFEEWAVRQGIGLSIERCNSGYEVDETHYAWRAWQFCRNQTQQP